MSRKKRADSMKQSMQIVRFDEKSQYSTQPTTEEKKKREAPRDFGGGRIG